MNWKYVLVIPCSIIAAALAMALAAERAAQATSAPHAMVMPASVPASSASQAPISANAVAIHNFAFGPSAIIVAAGATVTWTNGDNEPHSVVMVDRSFRSPPMDSGGQFSHLFATPGQYRYFCGFHPQMTGLVIVRGPNGERQ